MIFDIKRFAIHDGPGIRVTVFLKGCPLHCVWCHNPEGISPLPQKLYIQKKCIGCGSCIEACPTGALQLTPDGIRPVTEVECLLCGRCAEACPTLALELCGRDYELTELMRLIEKDREVMAESDGGVTLCGGEPLMQPELTRTILTELGKRGFHRCVDTTLFCPPEVVESVLPLTELFLVDLKHTDSATHRQWTGVPNERIRSNITLLSERNADFWIRIPLIEGVNADDTNLRRSAEFLANLPHKPIQINLLPYHDIGKGKHERLGTTYNPDGRFMQTPTAERQAQCLRLFAEYGLTAQIGG
ncbi:MAG: glycyl-radical enzyme activating protein [Bacteroidaceae bacterium]|nr:glycyl-radical enzyme activating protein [Bacteroidaceae bacterium]